MSRKQIAFDLDTKILENEYPKDSWRHAYKLIKSFMQDHGFDWQQGSVYTSRGSKTHIEIAEMIEELVEKYSWLAKSIRDCKVTTLGKTHDLTFIFKERADCLEK